MAFIFIPAHKIVFSFTIRVKNLSIVVSFFYFCLLLQLNMILKTIKIYREYFERYRI